MPVTLRTASPEDVADIAEWTQDTFHWGDYVADRLPEWIAEEDVRVQVAANEENEPVGVSVVRMLSETEGWLAAARVRPDSRRMGLGSILNQASVDWIRSRGGVVARLAIEDDNPAAQAQVDKLEYRRSSAWTYGIQDDIQPKRVGRGERLSLAGRGDIDPAWMFWSTSEMAEAGRGLIPSHWTWRRATVSDLNEAAKSQRFYSSPAGWVIVEPRDRTLDVTWVATSQNDFPRLLSGITHLAVERELETVFFHLPETGWSREALARAGIEVSGLYLYTKAVFS